MYLPTTLETYYLYLELALLFFAASTFVYYVFSPKHKTKSKKSK